MNKSFTLIEILVVIVVIGVLSAFILVGMSSISSSANVAKSKAFANSLRDSLLIDLISEWKLDGNANDSWGSNTGNLIGTFVTKTSNECVQDQCLEFNGSNNAITLTNIDASFQNLTLSSWLYIKGDSASGSYQSIFNQSNDSQHRFSFYIYNTDKTPRGWIIGTDGVSSLSFYATYSLSLNTWYHLAYVLSGVNIKIYINGEKKLDTNLSDSIYTTTTLRATIGSFVDRASYSFNGYVDNISFYKKDLSLTEIKQNYYSVLNNSTVKGNIDKEEYNNRLMAIK